MKHTWICIGLLCQMLAVLSTLGADIGGEMTENTSLVWTLNWGEAGRLNEVHGPGGSVLRITREAETNSVNGETTDVVLFGSESRRLTYDRLGRLVRACGGAGEVEIAYGADGHPCEVKSEGCPGLRYGYDALGRLSELRIGALATLRYRYDYLGRLAAIMTPVGEVTYNYQTGNNAVIRTLPNGVWTQRVYDDEGRLKEIAHADSKKRALACFQYGYRPDGMILTATEQTACADRELSYSYDLMHRLVRVVGRGEPAVDLSYAYDTLGNLAESKTADGRTLRFTSTPAGCLSTDSRGECRADARGQIRMLPADSGPVDFEYGENGKLSAAKGKAVTYAYNALEQLTVRTAAGRLTRYLPDPLSDAWQPLWRRDAAGNETVTVWDNGVPLLEIRGQRVTYRLEDYQGSVRIELDAAGQVAAWRDYSPYGKPATLRDGDDLQAGFAGLPYDPIAGVYLTLARAYDPVTARFLQPDPQLRIPGASPQTHSLYAYCAGDPVNWMDTDGAAAKSFDRDRFEQGVQYVDNYLTALNYYNFGWIRVLNGRSNEPLVLDTAPVASRRIAVEHALNTLGTMNVRAEDLDKAFKSDRFLGNANAGGYSGVSIGRERKQALENYSEARRSVEENPFGREIGSMLEYAKIGGWAIGKKMMQAMGWRPSDINLNFSGNRKDDYWLPTSIDTIRAQLRGVSDGARRSDSILKKIDDCICPPAYGGEIQQQRQSVSPRPVSGVYLGGAVKEPKRELPPRDLKKPRVDEVPLDPPRWPDPEPLRNEEQWPPGGGGGVSWSPSPVGGVYLGGAGKVLAGLGMLKGIAVDEASGNLILVAEDGRESALPPLRLDDVVTVFRAVYDHGQSPTVTINPDKKNPEGPTMDVIHGPGTEGTYVGWVLFECDRVMKTYQLGVDNVSKQPIASRVPGHSEAVDSVFFGNRTRGSGHVSDGVWERFWIVPDTVRRYDAAAHGLSLFDISLKVKTQKMKWVEGELVDDETGESSVGAKAFTKWFSEHYGEIAEEVRLAPPKGGGLTEPVAVFKELRRIATVAAVAERLRDQGQALPLWMKDYRVAVFPVAPTTPSLNLTRTNEMHISNIYGGVNLAPADSDVHAYGPASLGKTKPKGREDVAFVQVADEDARILSDRIPEVARHPLETVRLAQVELPGNKKSTTLVALPGAGSLALVPNRQTYADMSVPIGLGRRIALARHYNSFFDPVGEYGKGWTMNLPSLKMIPVPASCDGKKRECNMVPWLTDPLGTLNVRFERIEKVAAFKQAEMYVARSHPEFFGVASGNHPLLDVQTRQVLWKDGREWHFDDDGWLVLETVEGGATRYIRDRVGQVRQIIGYVGKSVNGTIDLSYDSQGRIVKVVAQQPEALRRVWAADAVEVVYAYNNDGRLASVSRKTEKSKDVAEAVSYAYRGPHLTEIHLPDNRKVAFSYNGSGQVTDVGQDGHRTELRIASVADKTTLTQTEAGGKAMVSMVYDSLMRPIEANLGNSEKVRRSYGVGHEMEEARLYEDRPFITRKISADGRKETTVDHEMGGSVLDVLFDEAGRSEEWLRSGVRVAKAVRRPDGMIEKVSVGTSSEVVPLVCKEGWQDGVMVREPGCETKWTTEEWDVLGRTKKVADSTGFEYVMGYDEDGHLNSMGRMTKDGKLAGSVFTYDDQGRVAGVDSTWGTEQREYAHDGALKKVVSKRGAASTETRFDAQGRVASLRAFDGGETTWTYADKQAVVATRTIVLPDRLKIINTENHMDGHFAVTTCLGPAAVELASDVSGRTMTMTWRSAK